METWPRSCRNLGMTMIQKSMVVLLALLLPAVPLSAAPRIPTITLLYTTAETTTSAAVVWNTNIASDSLLQYSLINPIPANAPQVYVATAVTYHEIDLTGLTPGSLYYFRVTSCARKGCASATGTFETYPSCPDEVPPVSGSWQKVASPNVGGSNAVYNELLGVDAVSAGDAWAVGWSQDPNGPPYVKRTLIEHWDGTRWSIVPSPSPDTQFNELRGVAAVSANDAWAVGYRGGTHNETPIETLVLHWNGASWSQVASPNVPAGANQLHAVAAISASDVWAVGSVGGAPLALHWNGSAWSVIPGEGDRGLSAEFLTGISGAAGNDVWAVGQGRGFYTNQTFATLRHWDGTHWTEKVCRAHSASNPPWDYEGGGPDAYFTGVSAAATNDVWAVGVGGSGPFILHWDGLAWTAVTHPRAFPNAAGLRAVATSSGGGAWSVGFQIQIDPSGPEQTLIDRYTP